MRRQSVMVLALGGAVLVATLAGIAAARSGSGNEPEFNRVSNKGTAIAADKIANANRAVIVGSGATSSGRKLGRRGAWDFYSLDGVSSHTCYAAGRAGAEPSLGSITCPAPNSAGQVFPSAEVPVLTVGTSVGWSPASGESWVARLSGVAADGVAAVVVLDANGGVFARASVTNNVFLLADLERTPASAISALDASGKEIHRISLVRE
jgi:hypothetical protein